MKLARNIGFALSISSASLASLALAASAVGCGGSIEQTPNTTASAATKAPVAAQTHGMVKLVGDALGDVPLRADQRAIVEQLAVDAEARHAPLLEHRKALALVFADQIEKGTIDRTVLQPKVDALAADLDKVSADDKTALVKLHDTLDKDQRNTFVDSLEQRFDPKAHHGGPGGPGGPGGFGHLKELADDLKLTDDQRTQIRGIVHDSIKEGFQQHAAVAGERKGHGGPGGKHALESFRDDQLDVSKLGPNPDMAAAHFRGAADMHAEHVIGMAEKILPILTVDQRKIAADKLRQGAANGEPSLFMH